MRSATSLAGVLILASGCAGSTVSGSGGSTSTQPPACAVGADVAELGRPGQSGPPALFTTSGADLYVSASGFLHGGPLDPPTGVTLVSFGPGDKLPTFDRQRNVVTNVETEVTVREGEQALVRLPAGRHWLWSSNTVSIKIGACQPGTISDPHPIP